MEDIENLLESIHKNAVGQSKLHKKKYLKLKSKLAYFRLPIIIISACNAVFSIGLQPYLEQGTISLLNSGLALACGVIGSIELYLQINKSMEKTYISARDFEVLALDIFKYLHLRPENRTVAPALFVEDTYNRYIELLKKSLLLKRKIDDQLISRGTLHLSPAGFSLVPSINSLSDSDTASSEGIDVD